MSERAPVTLVYLEGTGEYWGDEPVSSSDVSSRTWTAPAGAGSTHCSGPGVPHPGLSPHFPNAFTFISLSSLGILDTSRQWNSFFWLWVFLQFPLEDCSSFLLSLFSLSFGSGVLGEDREVSQWWKGWEQIEAAGREDVAREQRSLPGFSFHNVTLDLESSY